MQDTLTHMVFLQEHVEELSSLTSAHWDGGAEGGALTSLRKQLQTKDTELRQVQSRMAQCKEELAWCSCLSRSWWLSYRVICFTKNASLILCNITQNWTRIQILCRIIKTANKINSELCCLTGARQSCEEAGNCFHYLSKSHPLIKWIKNNLCSWISIPALVFKVGGARMC